MAMSAFLGVEMTLESYAELFLEPIPASARSTVPNNKKLHMYKSSYDTLP